MLAGRRLDTRDGPGAPRSAVVSESLARELWPGESALGQQVRRGDAAEPSDWWTVVGVVTDVIEGSHPFARDLHGRTLYLPFEQLDPQAAAVTFRHAGDPRAAVLTLHDVVASLDAELFPGEIADFDYMVTMMGRMTTLTANVVTAALGSPCCSPSPGSTV